MSIAHTRQLTSNLVTQDSDIFGLLVSITSLTMYITDIDNS